MKDSIGSVSNFELHSYLISTFISALALPMYGIFLPLLSVNLGATPLEVGLTGGAAYAVYCFMPFVVGRFTNSNRRARLFILLSSVSLIAISYSYIVVSSPLALIATRVVEGFVWALFIPSIEAAVATRRSPESLSLGMFNLAFASAAAIGPLLGAGIANFHTLRSIFVLTTVTLSISFVINSFPLIWERRRERAASADSSKAFAVKEDCEEKSETKLVVPRKKNKNRGLKSFYAIPVALSASISVVVTTFFPAYAGSEGISLLLIGLAAFGFGITRFLSTLILTRASIRMRLLKLETRSRYFLLSFGLMSLPCLVFFIHDSTGIIYAIPFAFIGLGYSINLTIGQVALIGEAPHDRIGLGAGLFESSIGSGAFLAPVLAGALASKSLVSAFYLPFAIFFAMIAILGIRNRVREKHSD